MTTTTKTYLSDNQKLANKAFMRNWKKTVGEFLPLVGLKGTTGRFKLVSLSIDEYYVQLTLNGSGKIWKSKIYNNPRAAVDKGVTRAILLQMVARQNANH